MQPDSKRQKLASRYAEQQRRLMLLEWAIIVMLLLVLVFGNVSSRLSSLLYLPQPWTAAFYLVLLGLVFGTISLPLNYYAGYILPHRYGLSTQSLRSWLGDRIKAALLGLALGLAAVLFIYWTLDAFPHTWWLWSGVFLILASLLLARITPTLIISMFFKLEPLQDKELSERLEKLAQKAGSNISGIFTIDLSNKGTTANAMLGGLGKTRRIILTDTLLKHYTHEEIEVILAHELAHHILRHIPYQILLQSVITLLTLYAAHLALYFGMQPLGFRSMDDIAAFPYILLVLAFCSFLLTPLQNAYSRQLESNADRTALELSDNAAAFITAMTKLTDQNLSVAQPKRWVEFLFYDHPPYTKRVEMAHSYMERQKQEKED